MKPRDIDAMRQRLSLKQSDLAAIMGVNVRTIKRWERGIMCMPHPASVMLDMIDSGELPQRYWPKS